jgi:hypothetical protein
LAAVATPLVEYVQWVAGSATVEADAVAEAEAEADALAFALGAAGVLPLTSTAVSPPTRPRTQTTARPILNRLRSLRLRSS